MVRAGRIAVPLMLSLLLAACNSTESVLDPLGTGRPQQPVSSAGPEAAMAPEGSSADQQDGLAVQPAAAGGQPTGQSAAISSATRVQFAPIVGSTVESIGPLSRRLLARAAQRGIALAASGDATTTHVLKGYFSAISDDGETTVIYVWDVLDPSGNRLHRIQGQQKAEGGNGEGWAAVPAATMEAIGDRTIEQLAEWLVSRRS